MNDTTFEQTDIDTELPACSAEEIAVLPKKRRWIPYLILAILFLIGLVAYLCVPIKPQLLTDPEMPWFSICDGVLFYDSALYNGEAELTVPETVAGQTVTAIGGGCFAGDSFITTVNLPQTIESIGSSAFADCTALRGVLIPESVHEIGEKAFRGCTSLESVCIPYSVKMIGNNAFLQCPKLLHIFYSGPDTAWTALYTGRINAQTKIYTVNGTIDQNDVAANAEIQAG